MSGARKVQADNPVFNLFMDAIPDRGIRHVLREYCVELVAIDFVNEVLWLGAPAEDLASLRGRFYPELQAACRKVLGFGYDPDIFWTSGPKRRFWSLSEQVVNGTASHI